MGILATSVPYELDITKLAGMIGLSRNSVINYLQNLDKAELLKLLYSDLLSVKKMQKPDKIYLQNPNLLYAIASAPVQIGTARETFCRQPVIRKIITWNMEKTKRWLLS